MSYGFVYIGNKVATHGSTRDVVSCGQLFHNEGLTLLVDGEEEPMECVVNGNTEQLEYMGVIINIGV